MILGQKLKIIIGGICPFPLVAVGILSLLLHRKTISTTKFDHSHSAWGNILAKTVSTDTKDPRQTLVDYRKVKYPISKTLKTTRDH